MLDVCDSRQLRGLLEQHGFHFSKAKGQNFLIASWVPERIAEEAELDGCGVLEIGPGVGSLTRQLCLHADRVVAVELDRSLEPILRQTMAGAENLELLFGDVLKLDLQQLVQEHFAGRRPVACANLPYYITTPILTHLLQSRVFDAVTVMVQKELAQRICARAGTADYSAFTLFCRYYADAELLFDVPPDCFQPRPKVTSSVLRLRCRTAPPAEILDEATFFRTVRASFSQRRKTLVNGLSAGFAMDKQRLTALVCDCGFSPTVRGETLDFAQFAALSNCLYRSMEHV